MAIKTEKPPGDDEAGVVLLMARSPAEAEEARRALAAAGVEALLPAGAAEALFEAGREAVPIRVPIDAYRRGLEALGPLAARAAEDPDPEARELAAAAAAALAAHPDESDEPARDGPLLDEAIYEPSPPRRGPTASQVERSAGKALFISAGSLVIPGLGAVFALFGVYAGVWCLRRLETRRGVLPARGAIGIGLLSVAWNLVVGYLILTRSA